MPKKPKGGRRNKSWEKMRADYVTDPGMSLKKLSEKYGVPLRTIAEHSKAENWFATKKQHQEDYCNKLAEKLHQKKLDSLEQELESVQNLSDRLFTVLKDDPEQFNRHLTTNMMTGETTEQIFSKVDVKAMRDAVSVLKVVEDMKRSIIGLQRLENLQKHQLDVEKMQLEKERFEFEKQKAEFFKPTSDNAIRIEGFEEGWAE